MQLIEMPRHTDRPRSSQQKRLWKRMSTAMALCTLLLTGPVGADEDATLPQPVYTNKARFRIPFQYDAEEMARLQAVEIQLYLSTNGGRDWKHEDSVAPSAGKFTFEAPADAEYWFAVRTLTAELQKHPAGPLQPGLRVIVDQTAPVLQLSLRENSPGAVELSWLADDEHLAAASLRIEYLDPNTNDWRDVAITPASEGRTSWSVSRSGRVLVRGTVADHAGNTISADASLELTAGSTAPPPVELDFSQPVAEEPSLENELAGAPDGPPTLPSGLSADETPSFQPAPLQRERMPEIAAAPEQPPGQPAPFADAEPPAEETTPVDAAAPDEPGPPTARINSTHFAINYAVDDAGPAGISAVELYITEDAGAKWYYYGPDEDAQSPVSVSVPRDGEYGFALRVRSGVAVVADPPQPGDPPEMTIIVDRRPPRAELLGPAPSPGPGQVVMRWQVTDEQLAERPVALSYAASPTGPWEPITGWRENTGEYIWTPPAGIQMVWVRLEARDAAGNIARVESVTPLAINPPRPTARFVDVEATGADEHEPQQ